MYEKEKDTRNKGYQTKTLQTDRQIQITQREATLLKKSYLRVFLNIYSRMGMGLW